MLTIDQATEYIIKRLFQEFGDSITIHGYSSKTTNSRYLKLDYGASCSIRISDHKGYEEYHYRYELRTDVKESVQIKSQYFYSMEDIDKLLRIIIHERKERMKRNKFKGEFRRKKKYMEECSKLFYNYCKKIEPQICGL